MQTSLLFLLPMTHVAGGAFPTSCHPAFAAWVGWWILTPFQCPAFPPGSFLREIHPSGLWCTTPLLYPCVNSRGGYSQTTNLTELFPAWFLTGCWGGAEILEDAGP